MSQTNTNQKYSVLDFIEFRRGCNLIPTETEPAWDEIKVIFDIYDKLFPIGRIEQSLQTMLLKEIRTRLSKGYQWLRSSTPHKPYLLIFGTHFEPKLLTERLKNLITRKTVLTDTLVKGIYTTGMIGLDKNGIYISEDGINSPDFETYYFAFEKDMLSYINTWTKMKHFTLENWLNVNISKGKRGFNQSFDFQLFYNMYSAMPSTPQLFGTTSIASFFDILVGQQVSSLITSVSSEYYDVLLNISLPSEVNGVSTLNLSKYFNMVVRVNNQFIINLKNGMTLSDNFFNVVAVIGTSFSGGDVTGCRIVMCLGLVLKMKGEIMTQRPIVPISLNVQYHNTCRDMRENIGKTIWIGAGKGSGKSKIVELLKTKKFICIDSDLYGGVLFQMAINMEDKNIGCKFRTTDNPLLFAQWIYTFSQRLDFNELPSFHEIQAVMFCTTMNVSLTGLLNGTVSNSLFRTFSRNLTLACNRLLKVQDYCNLLGYIPTGVQGGTNTNPPTMVIFGHNTLELFPAMTNAIWKMEAFYDTTAAVLTRERTSGQLSQIFLCVYYDYMEPLITNSLPSFLIYRALSSLPDY